MINLNGKINDTTNNIIKTIKKIGVKDPQVFDLIRIHTDELACFVVTKMITEDLLRLNRQLKLFKN